MSIFVLNLVTNWMLEMGGIDYFQNKAHEQSKEIYDFIDSNSDVLDCKVDNKYRSKSNIVFNFLNDEHNKEFVDLAAEKGIIGSCISQRLHCQASWRSCICKSF